MASPLPSNICLQVSRNCNARCAICLAPADGTTVDAATLKYRLDWLVSRGVRRVHFCGGEPTLHPALPELLSHLFSLHGKGKVTTNGMEISDEVLSAFRATAARVKVSLHGDREHHNRIVGCDAFDETARNLRRMSAAGIDTSVQTTIVREGLWVLDWMIDFCLKAGVPSLTVLPFVPRGNGFKNREQFQLSSAERLKLQSQVKEKRQAQGRRLNLRWLDLSASRICVVRSDGGIVQERGWGASDRLLGQIPTGPSTDPQLPETESEYSTVSAGSNRMC